MLLAHFSLEHTPIFQCKISVIPFFTTLLANNTKIGLPIKRRKIMLMYPQERGAIPAETVQMALELLVPKEPKLMRLRDALSEPYQNECFAVLPLVKG